MALKNLRTTLPWTLALLLGCRLSLALTASREEDSFEGSHVLRAQLQALPIPGALARMERPRQSASQPKTAHDEIVQLSLEPEKEPSEATTRPSRARRRKKERAPQRTEVRVPYREPRQLSLPLIAGHNPFLGLQALSAVANKQQGPLIEQRESSASPSSSQRSSGWVGSLPFPLNALGKAGLKMTLAKPGDTVQDSSLSELAAEANVWPMQLKLSGKFH